MKTRLISLSIILILGGGCAARSMQFSERGGLTTQDESVGPLERVDAGEFISGGDLSQRVGDLYVTPRPPFPTLEQSETLITFEERTFGTGEHSAFWNFKASVDPDGSWSMEMGGDSTDDLTENRPWLERLTDALFGFLGGLFAGGGL